MLPIAAELIDFSDLLPALADIAGHALPEGCELDGRSFAWILSGEEGTPRESGPERP